VAEAPVHGHQHHRIVAGEHDRQRIQVREGTEGGAGQQGGAAVAGGGDGGGNRPAEDDLGQ